MEEKKKEETKFEIDDDLPGQGQFYCTPCARHFIDEQTRAVHVKSKLHKRRWRRVLRGDGVVTSPGGSRRDLSPLQRCVIEKRVTLVAKSCSLSGKIEEFLEKSSHFKV